MRWVVFLRAANVGKHNRFKPSELTKSLAKFGVVNIGAVGTFVVREDVSEATFRAALARQLPFKCEVMICPAKEIASLISQFANPHGLARPRRSAPAGSVVDVENEADQDLEAYVTVMAKRPARLPKLPIYAPSQRKWEVKVVRIVGTAVLSLRRRLKDGRFYPNQVIEKQFGVATTTRNWNTIEKVAKILDL
jgi:uncharacterized protein (DUF1697 family)